MEGGPNLSTAFSCSFLQSTLFVLPRAIFKGDQSCLEHNKIQMSCLLAQQDSSIKGDQKNVELLHCENVLINNRKTPVLKAFLTSATNFVYSPILIRVLYFFYFFLSILFAFIFDASDLEVEASEWRHVRWHCQ